MLLKELLPAYGIASIADLRQRLGTTKQYAWMLWHGKIGLSAEMLKRMHGELNIPLEVLLQVERQTPARRRGRPPKPKPSEGS